MRSRPVHAVTRSPLIRIEYLGFRNVENSREYRFAVHGAEAEWERRFTIPLEAFASRRALLQDGPDICYQRLMQDIAAGDGVAHDTCAIAELELTCYREAHAPPVRRSFSAAATAPPVAAVKAPTE